MANGFTSEQFRNMGVVTKDGRVITLKQHISECFEGAFEEHAHEFAAIFAGRSVDWPFPEKEITVKLSPVASSNIEAVGHDPEKSELHVKFRSGATHVYSDVSAADHAALVGADSIGSHFHKHVRSKPQRKL